MTLLSPIVDWLRGSLPAYPADQVERVSSGLGSDVLWSGAAKLSSSIETELATASWGYVVAALGVVILLGLATWLAIVVRRSGPDAEVGAGFKLAMAPLVGCIVIVLVGRMVASDHYAEAARMRTHAYVITPTVIVEIRGGRRTDYPGSALASVTREERSILIGMNDWTKLVIETAPADMARLDEAVDKVVKAAGNGTRLLKDRLG